METEKNRKIFKIVALVIIMLTLLSGGSMVSRIFSTVFTQGPQGNLVVAVSLSKIINFAVWVFVFLFLTIFGLKGLKVIHKPNKAVIELLGDYYESWDAGIHWLVPIFMGIRSKIPCDSTQILTLYMDEAEHDEEGRIIRRSKLDFTDDSAVVTVRIKVRVSDPFKATYNVSTPEGWKYVVREQVDAAMRGTCGSLGIDKALKSRSKPLKKRQKKTVEADEKEEIAELSIPEEIYNRVYQDLKEHYGVEFEEALITDIRLSETTETKRREIQTASKDIDINKLVVKTDALKGTAEGKRVLNPILEVIKGIEKKTGERLTAEQVMAYLKTGQLYEAMKSATIIATSEGGNLNAPVNTAATIAAVMKALEKKGLMTKGEGEKEEGEEKKELTHEEIAKRTIEERKKEKKEGK